MRHFAEMIEQRFRSTPLALAYKHKEKGAWVDYTWKEVGDLCGNIAAGLLSLGCRRGDRIAIWGATSLEWALCDLAALRIGAVSLGVYPTLTADDAAYILDHAETRFLFVQNQDYLDRIEAHLPGLSHLQETMIWRGETPSQMNLADLSIKGAKYLASHPDCIAESAAGLKPEDAAIFIYTSGTTGRNKGAVLSHTNLIEQATCTDLFMGDQTTISFLPMAHVAERCCNHYYRIHSGAATAFVEEIEALPAALKEVNPHYFGAVPRLYEKIFEKIAAGVEAAPPKKQKIFRWAVELGKKVRADGKGGLLDKLMLPIADGLVLRKIRGAFGKRCTTLISGAAPIDPELLRFFTATGMTMLEVYGLSESTGFATMNLPDANRAGSIGKPIDCVQARIVDGEIQLKGGVIFKGYHNDEEATAQSFTDEGWFKTGDAGRIDEEGYVWITGRLKNIIITAGAKNIMPTPIEIALCQHPLIAQALVHGDRRKYLTTLIGLEEEQLAIWARNRGMESLEQARANPDLDTEIRAHVDKVNEGLASFETIKDFAFLSELMTVENSQLTPTMKVKRNVVEQIYMPLLDSMYTGREA